MSGTWYTTTTVGSAASLSAVVGAVLYLFGDGLPAMKTKIGVEFRMAIAETVQSTRELPTDISAAGAGLRYGLWEVAAQFESEAEVLRRYFESPRSAETGR
jgi:hypothetical protein